jgi:hypothetical protein
MRTTYQSGFVCSASLLAIHGVAANGDPCPDAARDS